MDSQKRIKDLSAVILQLKIDIAKDEEHNRKAISTLHTKMFKKILDAEDEHDEELYPLGEEAQMKDSIIRMYVDQINAIQVLCGDSISELIPKQLCHSSRTKFKRLFCGFIRESYHDEMPSDIVDAIVDYYPIMSCQNDNLTMASKTLKPEMNLNKKNKSVTTKATNDELQTQIKKLSAEILQLKEENQIKDNIIKSMEIELESVLKLSSSSKTKPKQQKQACNTAIVDQKEEKENTENALHASRGVIGIIGAGKMGSQLATLLSLKKYEIVLIDRQKNVLTKSKNIHKSICDSYLQQKLISKQDIKSAKISFCESLSDLSKHCDAMRFIIDTSHDQYKRQVLAQISKQQISKKCIVITHSTKKCLTEISSSFAVNFRSKLIGINLLYFELSMQCNQCIEIIPSWNTSADTIHKCKEFVANDLNRTGVVLQDSCSFVSNRLLAVYVNEAFHILAEKLCSAKDLDKIQTLCLTENGSVGPFALADKVGLNVIMEILDELYKEYGAQKYVASALLKQYVRCGKIGRNTGCGVYRYNKIKR